MREDLDASLVTARNDNLYWKSEATRLAAEVSALRAEASLWKESAAKAEAEVVVWKENAGALRAEGVRLSNSLASVAAERDIYILKHGELTRLVRAYLDAWTVIQRVNFGESDGAKQENARKYSAALGALSAAVSPEGQEGGGA